MSIQSHVTDNIGDFDSSDEYSSTSSGYVPAQNYKSPKNSDSDDDPVDSTNLPSLSEQNNIIKELLEHDKMEDGVPVYAISNTWYNRWKNAVLVDSYSTNVKFPPKLNNNDIYDKENNCLDYDKNKSSYLLVNKEIWGKVQEWYPGGPEIKIDVCKNINGIPTAKTSMVKIIAIYKDVEKEMFIWKEDAVKTVKRQFLDAFEIKVKPDDDDADNILSDSEVEAEEQEKLILNNQEDEAEDLPSEKDFRLLDAYSHNYVLMNDSDKIEKCNIIKRNKIILDYKENGNWANQVQPQVTYQPTSYYHTTASTAYSPYSNISSATYSNSYWSNSYYGEPLGPGKVGLQNIGNTCFFNSGTQCLLHTKPLVKDLLREGWDSEINTSNPLGLGGRLAVAFQDLLKKVWDGTSRVLEPSRLKSVIGQFNDIFASYGQQDAHEFLIFLLDGIHEDLNRCIEKPLVETVNGDGTHDEETAAKAWEAHKLRNDSIITDRFQAQLRSKLTCPECHKTTVVFDPYTTLSLPISKQRSRKMTITFVPYDLTKTAEVLKIEVRADPSPEELDAAVSKALNREVKVQGATSTNSGVVWTIEEPASTWYRPIYFAFELLNPDLIHVPCCVVLNSASAQWPDYVKDKQCSPIFLVGVDPKLIVKNKDELSREEQEDYAKQAHDAILKAIEERTECYWSGIPETDESNAIREYVRPNSAEHEPPAGSRLSVTVDSGTSMYFNWQDTTPSFLVREAGAVRMAKNSATVYIGDAARADPNFSYAAVGLNQDCGVEDSADDAEDESPVALADCFEMFTQEETLDENNEWFCPNCRKHVCATKKMDLWSTPQVLIVHLKRFSGGSYSFRKDERRVEYPDELDVAPYVVGPHGPDETRYRLYAVSEHMGGMGGGHYTAHAVVSAQGETKGEWYSFNDSSVHSSSRNEAHNGSAYLLFYQRVDDMCPVIEDTAARPSLSSSSSSSSVVEGGYIPPARVPQGGSAWVESDTSSVSSDFMDNDGNADKDSINIDEI